MLPSAEWFIPALFGFIAVVTLLMGFCHLFAKEQTTGKVFISIGIICIIIAFFSALIIIAYPDVKILDKFI